jgi:nucleoside-diphosphate-sugar epimerase
MGRGVDLKFHEFSETEADDFVVADLRDRRVCYSIVDRRFDEVYQLAADMGGAGYIFTGEHDAGVMHNSATINLNMLEVCHKRNTKKIFYSSSACIYPAYNQEDPLNQHRERRAIHQLGVSGQAGKSPGCESPDGHGRLAGQCFSSRGLSAA